MGKHIFANDIRARLEQGEKRIGLEKGQRLSPSAADLIREYGAEVVYTDTSAQPPAPGARSEPASEADRAPRGGKPVPAKDEAPVLRETIQEAAGTALRDGDVEKILERVLARLAQVKGAAGEPPSGATRPSAGKPASADDDMVICRCEEITKGQIREAIAAGMTTLSGVKRVTRAGMGLCQGQTCQRLVTQLLCQELGITADQVKPITDRPPVRPVPLKLLSSG